MRQTAVLPPVTAADRHEVHLGHDKSSSNGRSDLCANQSVSRVLRRVDGVEVMIQQLDVPRQFDLSAGTDLRGALLAEANVAVEIADRDVGL